MKSLLLALTVLLAGCASGISSTWLKDGSSSAELTVATEDCKARMTALPLDYDPSAFVNLLPGRPIYLIAQDVSRRNAFSRQCMTDAGFHLAP